MDPHSSHSQKVPYARKEKRKSLFSKVKESVKDMLSPSWLSDLVTNVKKDSPPQSSDKGQLKVKDAFMSPLSSMPVGSGIQRPGMQQLQTDFLPFQNQATSLPNGQPRTLDYRMPTMGSNEGMSPYSQINIPPPISEFSSSQLPLARLTEKSDSVLANEDTMSQRSDVSKSTSGCSSMVPQTDLRGSSGGVGLTKRKASDGETTNSRSPLSLQDQPSKRQRLQVNINSSNTWSRRLNDTVTKQQLPAAVNKPSFNSSLFGSPMTDESSLLGSSFHESSFYPGKTTFGGRSSVGFRTNKRKTDLNQSLPSRLSIPVKAFMKAKPRANPTKEAVTSSTAKRILDALDKMPTPLNDARRIPVILPQHWTESSSFFSRDKTTGPHGPPTQQLNISSLASISKNRQVSTSPRRAAPQPSTSQSRYDYNAPPQARPSRQDTVMLGNTGPAAASSGKMKRDKSYHRGSASAKTSLEQEDTVILPEIKGGFGLPMTSMPKFNFSTPSGSASSQSKPAPSFAPVNFTFSSPIQETVPRTKPASPQGLTGFQFSSPIRVDDKTKETANTDKDTSNKQMFAFSTPVPSSNTTPVSKMNGPSTPVNSFSGGMQPAATLKQGSVMDILGGGGGGFKPAAELKKGSVMDFLGEGQDSDTEQDTSVLDILHSAKKSTSSSTTFPASSSPSGFLLFTGIGGVKPSTGPALSSLFKAQGWSCDACLLNNKEEASKCVACQSPRPGAQPKAAAPAAVVAPSLSAMFKPSGWSCDICLVNNSDSADKCLACQTAKPRTSTQKTDVSSNLLSKFQQPSGSWTCDACLLQNKSVDSKCVACQTSKPGSATPSHTSLVASHGSLMPGNWICNTCLIQNRKDVTVCGACQSAKPSQTSLLNAGVGKQQINNIVAEISLPAINPDTLKKREQEIDKYLKEVSNDTTENTAPTQLKSNQATQNTDVKIKKESIIVFDLETTGLAKTGSLPMSTKNDSLFNKLKPSSGTWECEVCLVQNKPDVTACVACQTSKPLSFFKHPPGDWTCDTCLVNNKETDDKCVACSYARPGAPRTHTVPSCVKEYISSQTSGFTVPGGTESKSNDSQSSSSISISSTAGFKFAGNDTSSISSKSGFTFGSNSGSTTTDKSKSESTPSGGGFKFTSTESSDKPTTGGFKFGSSETSTGKQKQESGFKIGGSDNDTKGSLAVGGFQFNKPSALSSTISNSVSVEPNPISNNLSTGNAISNSSSTLQAGFVFGQTAASSAKDTEATKSVPGGFNLKSSDSSAKSSEPSISQSSLASQSIGGFTLNSKSTSVPSASRTSNNLNPPGGFNFTATKVTENNTAKEPPKVENNMFSGFQAGSKPPVTTGFSGFNFAQQKSTSQVANSTISSGGVVNNTGIVSPNKRGRDEESGETVTKKQAFGGSFGGPSASVTSVASTPFQMPQTNSSSSGVTTNNFVFGQTATTTANSMGGGFNFNMTKSNSAPAPVFGGTSAPAQAAPVPVFGSTSGSFTFTGGKDKPAASTASTTQAPALFQFGAKPSQETVATASAFGSGSGFGAAASSTPAFGAVGAGSTPAFGVTAPAVAPAFGSSNPVFGSTNAVASTAAAPVFGGGMIHVTCPALRPSRLISVFPTTSLSTSLTLSKSSLSSTVSTSALYVSSVLSSTSTTVLACVSTKSTKDVVSVAESMCSSERKPLTARGVASTDVHEDEKPWIRVETEESKPSIKEEQNENSDEDGYDKNNAMGMSTLETQNDVSAQTERIAQKDVSIQTDLNCQIVKDEMSTACIQTDPMVNEISNKRASNDRAVQTSPIQTTNASKSLKTNLPSLKSPEMKVQSTEQIVSTSVSVLPISVSCVVTAPTGVQNTHISCGSVLWSPVLGLSVSQAKLISTPAYTNSMMLSTSTSSNSTKSQSLQMPLCNATYLPETVQQVNLVSSSNDVFRFGDPLLSTSAVTTMSTSATKQPSSVFGQPGRFPFSTQGTSSTSNETSTGCVTSNVKGVFTVSNTMFNPLSIFDLPVGSTIDMKSSQSNETAVGSMSSPINMANVDNSKKHTWPMTSSLSTNIGVKSTAQAASNNLLSLTSTTKEFCPMQSNGFMLTTSPTVQPLTGIGTLPLRPLVSLTASFANGFSKPLTTKYSPMSFHQENRRMPGTSSTACNTSVFKFGGSIPSTSSCRNLPATSSIPTSNFSFKSTKALESSSSSNCANKFVFGPLVTNPQSASTPFSKVGPSLQTFNFTKNPSPLPVMFGHQSSVPVDDVAMEETVEIPSKTVNLQGWSPRISGPNSSTAFGIQREMKCSEQSSVAPEAVINNFTPKISLTSFVPMFCLGTSKVEPVKSTSVTATVAQNSPMFTMGSSIVTNEISTPRFTRQESPIAGTSQQFVKTQRSACHHLPMTQDSPTNPGQARKVCFSFQNPLDAVNECQKRQPSPRQDKAAKSILKTKTNEMVSAFSSTSMVGYSDPVLESTSESTVANAASRSFVLSKDPSASSVFGGTKDFHSTDSDTKIAKKPSGIFGGMFKNDSTEFGKSLSTSFMKPKVVNFSVNESAKTSLSSISNIEKFRRSSFINESSVFNSKSTSFEKPKSAGVFKFEGAPVKTGSIFSSSKLERGLKSTISPSDRKFRDADTIKPSLENLAFSGRARFSSSSSSASSRPSLTSSKTSGVLKFTGAAESTSSFSSVSTPGNVSASSSESSHHHHHDTSSSSSESSVADSSSSTSSSDSDHSVASSTSSERVVDPASSNSCHRMDDGEFDEQQGNGEKQSSKGSSQGSSSSSLYSVSAFSGKGNRSANANPVYEGNSDCTCGWRCDSDSLSSKCTCEASDVPSSVSFSTSVFPSPAFYSHTGVFNNTAAPAAPTQATQQAVFAFGAKPADTPATGGATPGFNFTASTPAGLANTPSNYNFGSSAAPGNFAFNATATPGESGRKIKKAVRKLRR